MALKIEDGKGRGRSAGVSLENRLLTDTITNSVEHHANQHEGLSYSMLFEVTPTGADDCFLYLKNGSEIDITVEGFWLKLAANEYIDVKIRDEGTPAGGTDVVPRTLNTGSSKPASGTFQTGNNITGLTNGDTVYRIYHASSNGSVSYNFDQDIIITQNQVLTLYCQTGTTALAGFLNFYYHDASN